MVNWSPSNPFEMPQSIGGLQILMAVVKDPETQLVTDEEGQHPNYGSFPVTKGINQVKGTKLTKSIFVATD